jgi:hypothetical protein
MPKKMKAKTYILQHESPLCPSDNEEDENDGKRLSNISFFWVFSQCKKKSLIATSFKNILFLSNGTHDG